MSTILNAIVGVSFGAVIGHTLAQSYFAKIKREELKQQNLVQGEITARYGPEDRTYWRDAWRGACKDRKVRTMDERLLLEEKAEEARQLEVWTDWVAHQKRISEERLE